MSLMFKRVRCISGGTLISDEDYFNRLQTLHHERMNREQFAEVCAESFPIMDRCTDNDLTSTLKNDDGAFTCQPIRVANAFPQDKRIQMPFITTPLFNKYQDHLIPLRWMPLVIEMELDPESNCWHNGDATWSLSDINLLMTVVKLDIGLDNVMQQRWQQDRIPMMLREWHTM